MQEQIFFIQNKTDIDFLWPMAEPLLQKCVMKAVHGEYTTDDIAQMILNNRGFVIMTLRDGEPSVALAIEWVIYPRIKAANIMALGGKDLMSNADTYWQRVIAMLKSVGIEFIECSCSDAMARMLSSKLDFEKTYQVMRLKL